MIHLDISTLAAGMSPSGAGAIDEIHRRCGIYTRLDVVSRILDEVGWCPDRDLLLSRLLEPSAGDARFVAEAARRLLERARRMGVKPTLASFRDRILAFEFHEATARLARSEVAEVLRVGGLHPATAAALARQWIRIGDFLLSKAPDEAFTHVVGNPPYIRWSKIPPALRSVYDAVVPRTMVGGDLFVPFLDRSLDWLAPQGRCGFLCSDRWRYMAFGNGFREKWLPRLDVESEQPLPAHDAFIDAVDAYPSVFIARKRAADEKVVEASAIWTGTRSLADAGYVVRVGPALGCMAAYVVTPDDDDVETGLTRPWLSTAEISDGAIHWRGSQVIAMYDAHGTLIDLADHPLLSKRLERFRGKLSGRAIVKNGAPWYRTIDRVRAADWTRPKLLVPELAKIPRIALDLSGAIPSHGVYAIFAPDDDLGTLMDQLRDGGLARALLGFAPKVKGGYVRCYKRFLEAVPVKA